MSRESAAISRYEYKPLYQNRGLYKEQIDKEDYKCGNCAWFLKGCPRKETLINAEPCNEFNLS